MEHPICCCIFCKSNEAREIQHGVLVAYKQDFSKHAPHIDRPPDPGYGTVFLCSKAGVTSPSGEADRGTRQGDQTRLKDLCNAALTDLMGYD